MPFSLDSLVLEERNHNSTRSCVSADHAAHGGIAHLREIPLPNVAAILNIFQQQRIGNTAISQQHRPCKIDASGFIDFLHQQVVALLGATGLALHGHQAVFHRDDRLDGQEGSGKGGGGRNSETVMPKIDRTKVFF